MRRCHQPGRLIRLFFVYGMASATAWGAGPAGHQPEVAVRLSTRIDWTFALANQSVVEPPKGWIDNYESAAQKYELYVPRGVTGKKPAGLIVFISPGQGALGLNVFRKLCDDRQLIFASPLGAGNETPMPQRVRLVLDVLDDLRRQFAIDAERTYLGGFSGGGRVACAIAFSLPEYFGGVLPVCAGGDLREESWLRQRVIDRLSVAHLTGDGDFNRGEVERFRGPMLAHVGVRSRVWVAPMTGHSVPGAEVVTEAVRWLEQGADARRKQAKTSPAGSVVADAEPSRENSAAALLAEGKTRVERKETLYSGLMQLQGVMQRWPDLPQAAAAKEILLKYEAMPDRAWEQDDLAEQRKFLIARAKGVSDYATGPLPDQYRGQQGDMLAAAISLWQQVLDDGQDADGVSEGKRRLPELKKLAQETGK